MLTIPLARPRTRCGACILMLAALLLSGCGGELAYKRGATPGDLEAAKKSCREKGDSAAAAQCMADSGWAVQNLGRMEPLDADPVVEASVIPSDRRIENAVPSSPAQSGAERPKRKPDPLDTFKVSSWWKAGSGAASLASDTDACVASLGEAHRPDSQTQAVTRGLLLCMKDKGWSGLRAK